MLDFAELQFGQLWYCNRHKAAAA